MSRDTAWWCSLTPTVCIRVDYWPALSGNRCFHGFPVSLQDLGLRKPDPDIYQYVLETRREFEPQDAVFFDDVRENVDAAVALGIKGVLVSIVTQSPLFCEYDFQQK